MFDVDENLPIIPLPLLHHQGDL